MIPSLVLATDANSFEVSVVPEVILEVVSSATGTTGESSEATPSGGVSPYTYSWVRTGGASTISASSPSSATTDFSYSLGSQGIHTSTFRVDVTDDNGQVKSANVIVDIYYFGDEF